MYLVCRSVFSPIHSFSASDSSENIAPESSGWRGANTPGGAGVAVGSGVVELTGVAVGLSVGVAVASGVGVFAGTAVAAAMLSGAGVSFGFDVGVPPVQANRATISIGMISVAGMRFFSSGVSFFVGSTLHSTCLSSQSFRQSRCPRGSLKLVPLGRGLGW